MTPLHWACKRDDAPMVDLLLFFDAPVHAIDIRDRTPFDIAEDNDNAEVMRVSCHLDGVIIYI